MLRPDRPGSCATVCVFEEAVVSKGIDVAIQNGTRVINMSMVFPKIDPIFSQAIDRATAAGVVVLVGAGNNGASQPSPSSLIATRPEARGTVIIAGALNNAGTDLASFSNRAGAGAEYFLAAVGEGMMVFDKDGAIKTALGTSFSTPTIAGAVALLAQAFPNLTGQQIVNLLLTTATDLGAPGTDSIYGRGALNLTGAFAPQGTMSLAGSKVPVSLTSNGILSRPMGDAAGGLPGTVFLDGYARAYKMELGRTLYRAIEDTPLYVALAGGYRTSSSALGPLSVSVTRRRNLQAPLDRGLEQMEPSRQHLLAEKAIAGTAVGRISSKTAVGFAVSEGGKALQQRLSQQHSHSFLIATDPLDGNGFRSRVGSSMGMRHDFGPVAFTMTSEGGDVYPTNPAQLSVRSGYRAHALVADRRLGRLRIGVGGLLLDEQATTLGGSFSSAFSSTGSATRFADGASSLDLGRGWGAHASYRHGWTSIRGGDALVQGGRLSSNAFALDLMKSGVFARADRIGLRIMQPLRVRNGGLDVNLPTSYDYASGTAGYEHRILNLAPSGRELDYELSYGRSLLSGTVVANAFVRIEPGHIEQMKNDVGAAIRFTLGF